MRVKARFVILGHLPWLWALWAWTQVSDCITTVNTLTKSLTKSKSTAWAATSKL